MDVKVRTRVETLAISRSLEAAPVVDEWSPAAVGAHLSAQPPQGAGCGAARTPDADQVRARPPDMPISP